MAAAVAAALVSTTNDIPGHGIVRPLGAVRGITMRSRSIVGNLGAALQTLVGGNITIYTELCGKARGEAFDLMLQHTGDGCQRRGGHALPVLSDRSHCGPPPLTYTTCPVR